MKTATRCVPYGALPYERIEYATRMMAKLFEKNPYCPIMSKLSAEDSTFARTIEGFSFISIDKHGVAHLKTNHKFKKEISKLNKAYENPCKQLLEDYSFNTTFTEKFLQIIKKFKSPNAYVYLTGPFTLLQKLVNDENYQLITDASIRDAFIRIVSVKALWAIKKIHEYCPKTHPVIIFEEPLLCKFGMLRKDNENITSDIVTDMFATIVKTIKKEGGLVGIQSFEKCDWQIPINAGIDLIFFDAYNNPNNLNIIPDKITEFISRGGKICWGIVPVMTESVVKYLNIDDIRTRFLATLDCLVGAGVPERFVYNSALVSVQGDTNKLELILAEKALITAVQLSKKIPLRS